MNRLLTYKDVAERWGVTVQAVKNWKRRRRIEALRIGRTIRFTEEALSRAEKVIRAKI